MVGVEGWCFEQTPISSIVPIAKHCHREGGGVISGREEARVGFGTVFRPVRVNPVAMGGHFIIPPVKGGFTGASKAVDRRSTTCCERETGNKFNLVAVRTAMIRGNTGNNPHGPYLCSSSAVRDFHGIVSKYRTRKTGISVRLRGTNPRKGTGGTKTPVATTADVPSIYNHSVPGRLAARRICRLVGNCNRTTEETVRTKTSTIRVRVTRNCLMDAFLSPEAGGEISRFNKYFRGHVHFSHLVVRRIGGTARKGVTILTEVGYTSRIPNKLSIRSDTTVTTCLRDYKLSKLRMSHTIRVGSRFV